MSATQLIMLGEGAGGGPVTYIEDVFSTYLYTGNGSTQTITNGIDLSTKGGLVWGKSRSVAADNVLVDSARGIANTLVSNSTGAQNAIATAAIGSFNSNGFSFSGNSDLNANPNTYASWTFREQPKFFDVVTYTGNGVNSPQRNISHSLGSAPGCVIIKATSTTSDWGVWHRGSGGSNDLTGLSLNTTAAATQNPWGESASFNSSTFAPFLVKDASNNGFNTNGVTYVAYLFAHNAGGFGLTGTDNVITCGSYTGNGSTTGPVINLGYEPQWLMIKRVTSTGDWFVLDSIRGIAIGSSDQYLFANSTAAEASANTCNVNATGFQITSSAASLNTSGNTYIYMAIRRGPMKVPTDATKVFGVNARTGTGANATVTGGQTDDFVVIKNRGTVAGTLWASRLTANNYLQSSNSLSSQASNLVLQANPCWDLMDGVKVGTTSAITNASGNTFINYLFQRAPSFTDVLYWSGTGTQDAKSHNLTVAPEIIIVKKFSGASTDAWWVYNKSLPTNYVLRLDGTDAQTDTSGFTYPFFSSVNASTFTVGDAAQVNESGSTYSAFLFATCAGVSKIGSYTGTGATQTIACGFAGGARFVLIKRTDSIGAWYVWDTTRGMVAGTDPYIRLNNTSSENNANNVYTTTGGFQIVSTAADINASGGSYIYLAIA